MPQEVFVGPGGFATIQQGVDAVDPGGVVRVAPGLYNETVIINKPLQLLGAQAGVDARTRLGTPSEESRVTGTSPVAIIQVLVSGVVIDGFTVEGNAAGAGIFFAGTASGHVLRNTIVRDNVFGVYLNSNGASPSLVQFNSFRSNNRPGAASGNGIYTDAGLSQATIEANSFTGHATASVNLGGTVPGTAAQVVIRDNQLFEDNSIAMTNALDVQILGNVIQRAQGSAIFFGGGTSQVTIEGNLIQDGVSDAIRVTSLFTGTPNSAVAAHFNSIQGNATGLRVDAGAYAPPPLDATNNWWGSPSGPSGVGPGTGQAIVDPDGVVVFQPFLTSDPVGCPPGQAPGTGPGTAPGFGPGTGPGTGSGTGEPVYVVRPFEPCPAPGTGFNTGPGSGPGTGPGTAPGTGPGT